MATTAKEVLADVPQTGICVGAVVEAESQVWGASFVNQFGPAKRRRGTVVEPGIELDLPESCPAPLSRREPIWSVRYEDDGDIWATP